MSVKKVPIRDAETLWKRAIWQTILRIEREKQYKPNTSKKKDNEKTT